MHEVMFGSEDKTDSKRIAIMEREGLIRNIAPRIYTSNFDEKPAEIILRNWLQILSNLYPDALLSHRSALEFKPVRGNIFLTYTYTKNIELPGLTIHFIKGPQKTEEDQIFFGELCVSNEARAFLENLQQSRKNDFENKTLSQEEIEDKLEIILKIRNENNLNKLRDDARRISVQLGMEKEFKRLDKIISALLTTKTAKILTSEFAKRRVLGEPIDKNRVLLFEKLYETLCDKIFPEYFDKNDSVKSYRNFGFFESYFSNYIEGTVFEIDEAKEIIATEMPLQTRNDDSHDVLGTYKIVSNKNEMSIQLKDADHFVEVIQYRHSILLSARESKNPGQFKHKNNFAGSTAFVDHKEVLGTLKKGFDYYMALRQPFAKAIYMMFLVSEVHPFLDGNGRIARVMMNAELTKAGQSKIIIPTVFREDYMGALKKMTRQKDCETYVRMMLRAWEFSKNIYGNDMDEMEDYLRAANAFLEPDEGMLKRVERH